MDGGTVACGRAASGRRKKSGQSVTAVHDEQEAFVDEFLEGLARATLGIADDDDDDNEPPSLKLFYPVDYAVHTWFDHKEHGTWAEGACYNDQDPQLMEDWRQLSARYNWWITQVKDERKTGDFLDSLMEDGEAQGLGDMFGG